MNGDAFLQDLHVSAFERLAVPADYVADLQGWVGPGFNDALALVGEHLRGCAGSGGAEGVVFVEVGSWKGASASKIVTHCKTAGIPLRWFVPIDTWLGAPEFYTWGLRDPTRGSSLARADGYPTVFYTFTRNMKALGIDDKIAPFPMSSMQAVDVLQYYGIKAHGMYIDGSHEYEAVRADLELYWRVLAPDGIMWGDDYGLAGVKKAVDEFARHHAHEQLKLRVFEDVNWVLVRGS